MEEERDYVVFTDDDGNDFELDVIRYFEYDGNEYAILADCGCACGEEGEEEGGLYIMRIIVNEEEDTEEFVSPDDKDMDALIELAEKLLDEECCCDCDECEGDCDDDNCTCHNH